MFKFAHLSDVHLPPLPAVAARDLLGKRVLGYLSWQRKRKHQHRPEPLAALARDLAREAPDHVCVTGDLTNLGLPVEMARAAAWLRQLGPADRVTLVPGNHDAYTIESLGELRRAWSAWMAGEDPDNATFPFIRRRAGLAFVGVSSAVPTPPFEATGRLDAGQLKRLRDGLVRCRRAGLIRVLLIHHPPQPEAVPRRRALTDAAALRGLLAEVGCELVLHGHAHAPLSADLGGPAGAIPVRGAGSASLIRDRHGNAGHYRIFEDRGDGRVLVRDRRYDPAADLFKAGATELVGWPGVSDVHPDVSPA
jgi:3',5'-cyclic AMP phosphodiesterase CpdA